jgi:23S rRNA pseudouridine2457 synthase
MASIILFNKPYGVLSQFSDDSGRKTLADYLRAPNYPVAGRLDLDSEGLLLLTDDGRLQQQIANPAHGKWKRYLVQVEGKTSDEAIEQLRTGIDLKDGPTRPAKARPIEPPDLWPRFPPVRERKTVPDSWLELSICEGRNRQVRRMTAAVGLPTLRLVRVQIDEWQLDQLAPGEHRALEVDLPGAARPRPGRRKRRTK